ncbi:hypothetical protein PI124_g21385 [Phytophthora idaei]|nr:hypothetical protein PI125_g23387 [Phytophthora idaei]KAG3139743.1 hypothetical protein PI126_g16318 [Phytophthora idaei]KAG3233543.1 hypothetical protein PI124_g21385 [Phytophthora idaei]
MNDADRQHELTIAEKKLVVRCYQFFELEKAAGN